MKKIFSVLAILSFLAVMAAPTTALAQATSCNITHTIGIAGCPAGTPAAPAVCTFETTPVCGLCCTLEAVYKATDWIFTVIMVVVGLLVIWGAFQIVTAGGSPEKVSTGRNYILYALIGLAIALLSKALPSIVKALLGTA